MRSDSKHRVEVGRRDRELVVRRRVGRGGVEFAAQRGCDRTEFARRQIGRAPEHHVLLGVRHPGEIRRIVTRADQIREIGRNDRPDRIAHDDDPQTVAQRRFEHAAFICRGPRRSDGEQHGSEQRDQ
jgi:hypothetical protein